MQSGIKLISRIYLKLVLLQVAVGTLLRIVLLFNEQTSDISFTFGQWLKIFLLGAVNDWCALTIGFAVLWLFALSIAPGKYARPLGYILFGILSVAWIYVTFFNTIFDEYGSVVPLIASILFGFWAVSFGLRLFLPQIRPGWRRTWLAVLTGLYTGGIILNAVSEWFFWSEFGVRYNFIAVDYLVYTNEVVGNIMESYPVVPLFAGVLLLTVGCTWLLFRREIRRAGEFGTWQWKAAVSPAYLLLTLGCCLLLQFNTRFQQSANTYANELQATGAYKFYDAFMKNELSYPQFYLTLPQKEAEANVHAIYGSTGDNLRHIPGNPDTLRRNIVLITIESMSASFMQHFGYPDAITPHLDSLYKMGIAFEQCFATGNRTVRGLEAVTLSLPPCPGQSIIKRPRNDNMHSTAAVLREKGYDAYYFYGGNSYFDNMETFFGGNGYRIIDQKSYKPEEITFANIWGVCDEDAYRKVIWQCNHKFDGQKCATPTLTEDEIKELFLRAANQVIDQREQFIAIYEQVLSRSLDTTALESELTDLEAEINIAAELIEECIKENAHVALDQAEYQKRYDGLVSRFDKAKARHTEVTDLIAERMARKHQIESYLNELRNREPLTEFRETDWLAMVDFITVHSKKDIRVTFKDGTEIKA